MQQNATSTNRLIVFIKQIMISSRTLEFLWEKAKFNLSNSCCGVNTSFFKRIINTA